MPKVTSLGHIGLHCNDFPTMFDFYTRVLGFTVTDKFPDRDACFLSARPAEEHHELLLTVGPDGAGRHEAAATAFDARRQPGGPEGVPPGCSRTRA